MCSSIGRTSLSKSEDEGSSPYMRALEMEAPKGVVRSLENYEGVTAVGVRVRPFPLIW